MEKNDDDNDDGWHTEPSLRDGLSADSGWNLANGRVTHWEVLMMVMIVTEREACLSAVLLTFTLNAATTKLPLNQRRITRPCAAVLVWP